MAHGARGARAALRAPIRSNEALCHFGVRGQAQPRAAAIGDTLPARAWQVLSAGAGTKGPRPYRWAWTDLARLGWPGWRHALLVREHRETGERAYYVVFAPATATLADVVRVAGTRWRIEQAFEEAQQEVGLDEYEVRKYAGWYRDVTLALCAHAFLAVVRRRAAPRNRGTRSTRSARRRSSRSPSPRSVTSCAASPSRPPPRRPRCSAGRAGVAGTSGARRSRTIDGTRQSAKRNCRI